MQFDAKRCKRKDGVRGRFVREQDFQEILRLLSQTPHTTVKQPSRYATYEIVRAQAAV